MSEEIQYLNNIALTFKRMSAKVKLIKLIKKAKKEYDSYDFNLARESLEEACSLEPQNPTALRGLGCLELFEKNYTKALEYYFNALKTSDSKELEYTLIGMVYYLQDSLDEAIEYFNKAITANDCYEVAYTSRNQAMLENHLKIADLQEVLKKYF